MIIPRRLLWSVAFSLACTLHAADFHVAPTGDDHNPGTAARNVECDGRAVWPASPAASVLPGLAPAGADTTHMHFTATPDEWNFVVR